MRSKNGEPLFLRPLWYAVAVFLFAVFDSTISPRIGILGTTPSMSFVLTVSASVFDGKKTGAVVGLFAGFLSDALGGVGISVLPLIWALIGWFFGVREHGIPGRDVAERPFLKRLCNFCICLALAVCIGTLTTAMLLVLTVGKFNIFTVFVKILLPEALSTFLYGMPIGLFMLLTRKSY